MQDRTTDAPERASAADAVRAREEGRPAPGPRAAWTALRRRAWTAAFCAALVPALAWIALGQVAPRWTATGSLIYAPPGYTLTELQSILRPDSAADAIMASQAEIVRGLPAAERLADELDLAARPEFNPALAPPGPLARLRTLIAGPPAPMGPRATRQAVLQAVLDHAAVKPLRLSRVMEVSFTTEDQALAAPAANLLMAAYIDGQVETKLDAVRRAGRWLEQRTSELRAETGAAEDRIAAYRAAHGLVQGVQAGLLTERISRLSADLAQARNDLAQARARLDAGRGGGPAEVAPSVVALRAQADQQRGLLQAALVRLGGRHPDVMSRGRQLADALRAVDAETRRVSDAAEAEARAAGGRVAALEASLGEAQDQLRREDQAQVPLNAMQRDADAARTLLQTVLERVQQTAQQAAIETADAQVVSRALPPSRPSFPPRTILLAGAAAAGLLLSASLVYLLELNDDTLRGGEDARRRLGAPCLALIPELSRRALRRAGDAAAGRAAPEDYVLRRPQSPYAEQVRALRAALWLAPGQGRGRAKVVAITAARPGEGKTALAAALGRSVAEAGERVLVIDCDVREAAFGRLMGAASRAGLMDVLTGAARMEDVTGTDTLTTMRYVPAGSPPVNAMQLFASDSLRAELSSLRDHYALILLDAPPASGTADARVVAGLADATVLCVRWRHTPARSVLHALGLLEAARARIAGVALTRVDPRAHGRAGFADSDIYHPRFGGYVRE